MSLPGRDLLARIKNQNKDLGIYLERYVVPAIQTTAQNAAVSPVDKVDTPAPPESVQVSPAVSGDMIQVTVNHAAPIQKGIHYVYSIADNPQFSGAMVEAKPATRAPVHFAIPTFKADGTTKHDWHVAVQTQYPGSDPSAPTYHGGVSPSKINLNGTAAMDYTPGTGSGTADNGGQVLVGLGKAQVRLGTK